MKKGKASTTAMATAAIRALESQRPDEIRVVNDPFATWFLGPKFETFRALSRWTWIDHRLSAYHDVKYPGFVGYVTCRYARFSSWLLDLIVRDFEQVVLLGAGYDMRFANHSSAFSAARLFELDHPATQARKQAILRKRAFEHTPNVKVVPFDLSGRSFVEQLCNAGFQLGCRNLFVMEGVSFYLAAEDLRKTFRLIRKNSAEGSIVLFDYMYRSLVEGTCTLDGAAQVIEPVRKLGEPYLFGLEPDEVEPFLDPLGFKMRHEADGDELREQYLRGRSLKIYPFARLVMAESQ